MKHALRIIVLWLSLASSMAGDYLQSELSVLGSQPWWRGISTQNYDDGSPWIRIGASTNTIQGSVPYTNVAGTYRVWLNGVRTYSPSSGIGIEMGGGSGGVMLTNNLDFVPSGLIVATNSFTNILITVTNGAYPSSLNDIYVYALYITQRTNEAPVQSTLIANTGYYFVDYDTPTTTNETDIVKGNRLQNSSFESGMALGWTHSRTPGITNYATWLDEGIDTSTRYSGAASVAISNAKARYQLFFPPFRLRGTNVWRPYTLSLWAKGNGPTLVATVLPVIPSSGVIGYNPQSAKSFSFGVPGTNWTRYTTNFYLSPSPTREFYGTVQHVSSSGTIWVDDIQLEEGGLTDWAPRGGIEFSTYTRPHGGHYFAGETPQLSVVSDNTTGSSTNANYLVTVYDIDNSLILSNRYSLTIGTGIQTNTITLPTGTGAYRVLSWSDVSGAYDQSEVSYIILPQAAQTGTLITNSHFGTHLMASTSAVETNRHLGIMWNRLFSTAQLKWSTIETNDGAWDWATADYTVNQLRTNSIIFAHIGDIKAVTNGSSVNTPAWGVTNIGGSNRIDQVRFERWVSNLVYRYKDRIRYWEAPNEPFTKWTVTLAAELMDTFVRGVTNADPTATIIGGGGELDVTYSSNLWLACSASTRAALSKWSVHLYPEAKGMSAEDDPPMRDLQTWGENNGLEIWNSEAGAWKYIHRHAWGGWLSEGRYVQDFWRDEVYTRSHWQAPEQLIRTAVRSVGSGHAKFFQYDSRIDGAVTSARIDSAPRLWELDDTLSPDALAYSTAAWLLNTGTSLRRVTNSTTLTNIESYLFLGSAGDAIIAAWTRHRSNAFNLTLTNTAFRVLDMFGREIQTNNGTVRIDRKPVYLQSSTMGTNTLKTTFQTAAATNALSTRAPYVSIDVQPRGTGITNSHLPLRFKWTALGQTWVNNTQDNQSRVQTRYKLEGLDPDWSAWTNTSVRLIDTLPASGNYRLVVQTRDADLVGTNTVYGQTFTVGPQIGYGATATANNATVGTLLINN